MAIDLVCGMEVKEAEAAGLSVYKGKKYYFCSKLCQQKFDNDPEKYLNSRALEEKTNEAKAESSANEMKLSFKQGEKLKSTKIDLPLVGMSCASCAFTIQRALSSLKGVDEANVNFATSKATVLYQPQLVKPEDFISSIRKSGYNVGTASVEISIQGMECASCVRSIEEALNHLKGVTGAAVNLATGKAKVEYIPSDTTLGEIKKTIENAGYKVLEIPEGRCSSKRV